MRCEKQHECSNPTVLFAAGINRLVYFRDLFRSQPEEVVVRQNFISTQDGNVDPEHAPPLGYGHLTTQEFRQLFETEFDQVAMIGLESPPLSTTVHTLAPEQVEAWMDLVETDKLQRD